MKKFSVNILVAINVAVAVFLLLSYVSVYVNPGKFWPAAFFGLAFPVIVVLNFLFFIFWIYARKRYFLISLVSMVIGWKTLASFVQVSSPKMENSPTEKSRLLTYNVKMLNFYNDADKNVDLKIFEQLMQNESPDIICLQEYFLPLKNQKKVPDVLYNFRNKDHHYVERSKEGLNYALAIFSIYPIINRGKITFDNTLNFCIFTDLVMNNDTVRLYNLHLQSILLREHDYAVMDSIHRFYDDNHREKVKVIQHKLRTAYIKRSTQASKVREHMENSKYKVVVCGDFNDTPVSYTYKHIAKGLNDAFIESGRGFGGTYIGKFPSFRIDYILHDNTLNSFNYRKLNVAISDHYPVVCDFY